MLGFHLIGLIGIPMAALSDTQESCLYDGKEKEEG